jgi:PAS domain S-box-containing protein
MNLAIGGPLLELVRSAAMLAALTLVYAHLRGALATHRAELRENVEGLGFGALASLAIAMPASLSAAAFDLGNAPIVLAVAFGGRFAGFIAAALAVAFRLSLGGAGTMADIGSLVAAHLIAVAVQTSSRDAHPPVTLARLSCLGVGAAVATLGGRLLAMEPGAAGDLFLQVGPELGLVIAASVVALGLVLLLGQERQRLMCACDEAEARFESLFNEIPHSLALHDLDDRLLRTNKRHAKLSGVDLAAFAGKTRQSLWDAIDAGPVESKLIQRVVSTGESQQSEPRHLRLEGVPRWGFMTYFPMRDASGAIVGVGTMGTDVTELLRAREQLATREAMLLRHHRAIVDAVHGNKLFERPMREAIRLLTELAGETLEVSRTAVLQVGQDENLADWLDLWDRSARSHRTPKMEAAMIFGALVEYEQDRVLSIEETLGNPLCAMYGEYLLTYDVRAVLAAPIYVAGRHYGYVIFSNTGAARQWTVEEKGFARSIANLVAQLFVLRRHGQALDALDLVEAGIYVQRDEQVIYANRAATEIAGLAQRGVAVDRYHGWPAENFPQPGGELVAQRDLSELTLSGDDGPRNLEVRRIRLPTGGTIAIMRDVTRQRAEQRERERLESQLQQSSKLQAIGQLAGGIAHDFNNLLGVIMGFTRFLEQDLPAGSELYRYAKRTLHAAERGKALVAQVLAFARAHTVERHRVDVGGVARNCRDLIEGLVSPTTRIAFEIDEADMPIAGNDAQVTQLLINLCSNADAALDRAPGAIFVRVAPVHGANAIPPRSSESRNERMVLGLVAANRFYAKIEVTDTGKGIPPEILPRIFDPFFTTRERLSGTGLGLAVVSSIVSSYEGGLCVDTAPGKGTTFSLFLPLDESAALKLAPPAGETTGNRGRERVLVIDDDVDLADVLVIALKRLGYSAQAINDPAEAIAAIRRDPFAWDVIITDQVMPGIDGIGLIEALKSIRIDLKIVLFTGLDDGSLDQSVHRLGIDAFFAKPVNPESIAASIRRIFDQAKPPASPPH